jgi:hypothetical protein
MHRALTGVHVLVTRTPEHSHWLAYFCWGLLIVTEEKGKATEISYSVQRIVHWLPFPGVSYCDNRELVFMFDYYTKEKEHQNTRQIWFILGGYAPSYKSDSLVFRCSFYYLHYKKLINPVIACARCPSRCSIRPRRAATIRGVC